MEYKHKKIVRNQIKTQKAHFEMRSPQLETKMAALNKQ